jgi:hypothetical protein
MKTQRQIQLETRTKGNLRWKLHIITDLGSDYTTPDLNFYHWEDKNEPKPGCGSMAKEWVSRFWIDND